VNEFPIQESKVQRPPLRDATLRRDRLLDWLHAKIHHRVVFVTAEAGYGKTTLLSDFARRTRLRTLWYRLDDEDRDWISLLNYLVAAGRQVEPAFAPGTQAMLREIGTGNPGREVIVDTFIHELGLFGTAGAVLIMDDYHLIDDVPDVRTVMREIVARAPERLTIVFLSRRRPTIPLARIRALGELVELRATDLRFDEAETELLFREAYGTPLEPDVLADLTRRTEGWAASLQLVQAAIRDRSTSEIRAFA
jgi:LuxR family maltose regulon positive regulatory protein